MASDEKRGLPGLLQEQDPDLEPLALPKPSAVLVDAAKPDSPPSPSAMPNSARVGDEASVEEDEAEAKLCDRAFTPKEQIKKTLAHEIEKKARMMEDRFLGGAMGKVSRDINWVASELGLSTDEVDAAKLSEGDDEIDSTLACTDAFVHGAASTGKMKLLASLYLRGLWDPQKDRTAIEAADEGGFLLRLLKHFQVRLSWFPSLAEELADTVVEELSSAPDVHGKARGEPAYHTGLNDDTNTLTHRTCLLANMLLVNSPVAAKLLSAAAEEIVVFRDRFPPVRRTHVKPFPDSLSTLYVKRFIKEQDAQKMKYNKKSRELWLPGSTSPTATSATAKISVPDIARKTLLIPLSAEEFCFVYPCDDLPLGGFLYTDLDSSDPSRPHRVLSNGRPVVVNKLCYEKGQQAFYFGEPIKLDQEMTSKIQKDLQDIPDDDIQFAECGANKFAWLMTPPEPLADMAKAQELNEKLKFGGFAFTFEDPEMNRVFPLTQVGAVMRMANLSWDINGCRLPLKPDGKTIEKSIAPTTGDRAAPVAIMRVCTPGALHPAMLHALAYTPREDVLQTNVAKAISLAAFDRAWPFYLQQICADCLSAAGLTMVTVTVHKLAKTSADHIWEWTWQSTAAYAVIGLVLFKNVVEEFCKMVGYVKCGWGVYYFSGHALLVWVGVMMGDCALLWRLPQEQLDHSWTRLALGLAGFVKWCKLVMYMRCILWLRLGIRVLPILGALREASSFIVVMLFFIAASTHFFYSVDSATSHNIFTSFFDAYRLGFLGDFDLTELWGENPAEIQYLGFMAISLLVMVSLTNIYIGVTSSAYDRNYDKAKELFVRARASICLDISMKLRHHWKAPKAPGELNDENILKDEYVWFCQSETDLDVTTMEDQGKSLISGMREVLGKELKAQITDAVQGSAMSLAARLAMKSRKNAAPPHPPPPAAAAPPPPPDPAVALLDY